MVDVFKLKFDGVEGHPETSSKAIIDFDTAVQAIIGTPTNASVKSVNGKTGEVTLTAEDVGALPANTQIPTYGPVTQTTNGLMIAADKKKLDGLSSAPATQTTNGYMTSTDKKKLDELQNITFEKVVR